MARWLALIITMALAELALYHPAGAGPGITGAARVARAEIGLASYAVLTACWLLAIYWLIRARGVLATRVMALVLLGRIALLVGLWGVPATFSDDSYRYRWEGLTSANGFNPYRDPPDSETLKPLAAKHAELHRSVFQPHWTALYPPVDEALFALNGILGGRMITWRIILALFETVLFACCWIYLHDRGRPSGWMAGLLLCPLLLFETHLDGHVDVAGVALLMAAVVTLSRGKWWLAAILLGLSFNTKYLWPGLAALVLAGQFHRQRRLPAAAAIFAATIAVCWLPFISAGSSILRSPGSFLAHWRFNATFWKLLAAALPGTAVLIITLAILLLLVVLIWRRRGSQAGLLDICAIISAALLLAPVSFPWYFIWLVPGLACIGRLPGLRADGPAAWVVVWLALVPSLHEYLLPWFGSHRFIASPWLPWAILAVILPLMAVCLWDHLRRHRLPPPPEMSA